ncbi:MAG: hypothetical protein J5858_09785, partial [Lentisphaeria bacterium]|nr:hypothetical protein [Lentisphaeria bacterium]
AASAFAEDLVIDDFKNFQQTDWKPFGKAKIEKTAEGVKVSATGGWVRKNYPGNWKTRADWDQKYNGIAFKAKGNGSNDYAPINVIVGWSLTFRWYIPLKNTNWQEYRIHFNDFVPAGCYALEISTTPGNMGISGFKGICFGDRWSIWHNNAKRQPVSFEIADIRLISDAKPVYELKKCKTASLENVKKRMKAGEKVKILCLGDSITAGTALSHPDGTRYADVTGQLLRSKYGCKGVTSKSFAVGGANSWDVVGWLQRDFDEIPDLVTFMCGYNDFSIGMSPDVYRNFLEMFINRVTALSKGKTAIVLFAPIPGCGPRFNAHDKYAQVVRDVAKKYGVGCFDANAVFKKKFTVKTMDSVFRDMAHPGPEGHRIIAENLAEFLGK